MYDINYKDMIKELKKIEFHDTEVNKLELDVINNLIKLEILIFNEKHNDYNKMKIEFSKLSNVKFENFFNNKDFSIEEISSFDLIENKMYRAEFTFLQGFSMASCKLGFDFESCIIK